MGLPVSIKDLYDSCSNNYRIGKNSREAFIKKLQLCMKTYDYKDETKDVRGKVTISLLNI
jgi:hypothetical protein